MPEGSGVACYWETHDLYKCGTLRCSNKYGGIDSSVFLDDWSHEGHRLPPELVFR